MSRSVSNSAKKQETKPRKARLSKQMMVDTMMTAKKGTVAKDSPAFITEDEFRARVAEKAYELYAQRQAITEADDWLNAERFVKEQLLAEGHHAGSV